MAQRLRIPKSPEEQRRAKAARQKRWRDKKARSAAVDAVVDHSLGLDEPGSPAPQLPSGLYGDDLATLIQSRLITVVGGLTDAGLLNKDYAPSLSVGLKAQALIDRRVQAKSKQGDVELAKAIIEMLRGGAPTPRLLNDGNTIEGSFDEVD